MILLFIVHFSDNIHLTACILLVYLFNTIDVLVNTGGAVDAATMYQRRITFGRVRFRNLNFMVRRGRKGSVKFLYDSVHE